MNVNSNSWEEALDLSIEHWRDNYSKIMSTTEEEWLVWQNAEVALHFHQLNEINIGGHSCALCQYQRKTGKQCPICPEEISEGFDCDSCSHWWYEVAAALYSRRRKNTLSQAQHAIFKMLERLEEAKRDGADDD